MLSRLQPLLAAALVAATGCAGGGALPGAAPLEAVAALDVERYLGRWYEIAATGKQVTIALLPDGLGPAEVVVHDEVHSVKSGESITVEL